MHSRRKEIVFGEGAKQISRREIFQKVGHCKGMGPERDGGGGGEGG